MRNSTIKQLIKAPGKGAAAFSAGPRRQAACAGVAVLLLVAFSIFGSSLGRRLQAALPETAKWQEGLQGLLGLLVYIVAFAPPLLFFAWQRRRLGQLASAQPGPEVPAKGTGHSAQPGGGTGQAFAFSQAPAGTQGNAVQQPGAAMQRPAPATNAKGRPPFLLLLPLFLGLMLLANSFSSLLHAFFAGIFQLPARASASLPQTFIGCLMYFVSSCLAAPLLEEALFRGGIQVFLRPYGLKPSLIATSLLFTFMHSSFWDIPTVFLLSLSLSYIAEISGSFRPCMALHFANNLYVFIMLLARQRLQPSAFIGLAVWCILLVLLAFAGAVWGIRRLRLGAVFLPAPTARAQRPLPGGRGTRLLLRVPAFAAGFIFAFSYFIFRLLP